MKKYIAIAAAILIFIAVAAFGAGDFNKPSGSSLRTSFMQEIRDMFADQAKWFSGTSTTNYPPGAIRYNSSTKTIETYNGSIWNTLDLTGLNVGQVTGKTPAAASGLATLDASSKVVQDPASASTTPGNNAIPKLSPSGVLALPNAVHTINGQTIWHAGNDGSGSGLVADSVGDGTNIIHTKIINIGDWDMDTTAVVYIAHGLNHTKIRNVTAVIRDDSDSNKFMLSPGGGTAIESPLDGYVYWNSVNGIILARRNGGAFDNAVYDATAYNRGWIVILYVD